MVNHNTAWQELEKQFEDFKGVLPPGMDPQCSELFDEFVREHEFGLALHVICDHLLESKTQPTTTLIRKIEALHAAMKIKDNCVASLQKKAAL
jgi:hypothetical protein